MQVSWSLRDELLFRREMLFEAPEKAAELEPMPPIDWLARQMTREFSAPAATAYAGEERRRQPLAKRSLAW